MKETMPEPSSQFEKPQVQRSFEVSIVTAEEAEANIPTPVRDNAFWRQFKSRGFAAHRIKESLTNKVFYIPLPFRTEANLTILHFRVPYKFARHYLDENVQGVARRENPELLKIQDGHDWAAGALWFMEYTKSDLGSQGNSQNGDYPELCMTFTATEDKGRKSIEYSNKYTIASVVANADFPSISAKLLLNNRAAIVAGRLIAGFDKNPGEIDVKAMGNEVSHLVVKSREGKQLLVLEIPKIDILDSLRSQIRLLRQAIKIYGLWRALIPPLKMILRIIPVIRNVVRADRCDGYTTLDLPFTGMPRRLRMDSDMNPWSLKMGELSSKDIFKYIDSEDRMFGALFQHAEFETIIKAHFRGAFSLAEEGIDWLSKKVGTVTIKEDLSG